MTAGEVVTVAGRYEAFDECALALPDGTWLRLGARPDDERARLLGRTVVAHGRLIMSTLVGATIDEPDELPIEGDLPPGLTGVRRVADVVTTHLAMDVDRAPELDAPDGVTAAQVAASVRFYRYLYDAVGAPWHWYDRTLRSDAELAAILDDPRTEVHVASERGTPIGYAELDRRVAGACELAYFGLVPEAIGRGVGRWLLAHAIHAAWRDPALRLLTVHTCTLDGERALATYQRAGFHVVRHGRHRQHVVER